MNYLRHSLVDDGIFASFANQKIRPLYDDNGHEEGSVARVLQSLTLGVCLQSINTQLALSVSLSP